jgi:F0F1-type ATP synthase epsilon subunit
LVVNEAIWLDEVDAQSIDNELEKIDKQIDDAKSDFQKEKLLRTKKFWTIAKENN